MKDYTQARTNMVKGQVMPYNVFDDRILDAMQEIPRHDFFDDKWQQVAYSDARLPLGDGRTALAPAILARMIEACAIKNDYKVLDIACGNGYSTVILSRLAGLVIGIDSKDELTTKAAEMVHKFKLDNVAIKRDELLAGAMDNAPYDVIFINGAFNGALDNLLMQLKSDGKLILIEPCDGVMKAVLYSNFNNSFGRTELFEAYAEYI